MYAYDTSLFYIIHNDWWDHYMHEITFWAYLAVVFSPEELTRWLDAHEHNHVSEINSNTDRSQIYLRNLRKAIDFQVNGERMNELIDVFNNIDLFD